MVNLAYMSYTARRIEWQQSDPLAPQVHRLGLQATPFAMVGSALMVQGLTYSLRTRFLAVDLEDCGTC